MDRAFPSTLTVKSRFYWIMMGCGLMGSLSLPAAPAPSLDEVKSQVQARSALLIDAQSRRVLFERNPTMKLPPASTVKLLTALVAYEKNGLAGSILITPADTRVEPSHIPLIAGEEVSLSDLIHSLIIGSDNDSGMAVARAIAGSVPAFVEMMNARARELGCTDSQFTNPHGLPDPRQVTTCRDLLRIFDRFLEHAELREIARIQRFALRTRAGAQTIRNHNKLLGVYEGMGPAKTGWTYASRHTYAASATRGGRELRLILLHSPNKWTDARVLFDYGFAAAAGLDKQLRESGVASAPSRPAPAPPAPVVETGPATTVPPRLAIRPSTVHTVRKGETLSALARRYGVSVEELMSANNLSDPNRIHPGQVLKVPPVPVRP